MGTYQYQLTIVTAAALSLAHPAGRQKDTDHYAPPANCANVELEVEAKATVARTDYRPMEPIWVRLDVKNETDHTWMVMSENPYRSVSIEVEKDGEPVGVTTYGEAVRSRRHIFDSIQIAAPGQTFPFSGRWWLVVNRVRDMTAPGEYSIKLSVPFSYDGEDVNGIYVFKGGIARANPVTVTVSGHPRPPDDR